MHGIGGDEHGYGQGYGNDASAEPEQQCDAAAEFGDRSQPPRQIRRQDVEGKGEVLQPGGEPVGAVDFRPARSDQHRGQNEAQQQRCDAIKVLDAGKNLMIKPLGGLQNLGHLGLDSLIVQRLGGHRKVAAGRIVHGVGACLMLQRGA